MLMKTVALRDQRVTDKGVPQKGKFARTMKQKTTLLRIAKKSEPGNLTHKGTRSAQKIGPQMY